LVFETDRNSDRFGRLTESIERSVRAGHFPGCVVGIVHRDQLVYRRAFGHRRVKPTAETMSADTIFDLASLTKPIVTATLIAQLVEQDRLHWEDPIARHWPAFAAHGKEKVTIEQCLLHTSGLIADNPLSDYEAGAMIALDRISGLKLLDPPGSRFRYSDVGYIVLGHVIERLTKQPLAETARQRLFEPLHMNDTDFRVTGEKLKRTAPTDRVDATWRTGIVHDPRARALGGSAGHAGLFSTVDDLARFCRMILRGGELDGVRILKPETVRALTRPVPVSGGLRTRGWDCDTAYSRNRGLRFPKGQSFGHTGFTGTSIWIDPKSQTAVIFLSNRVHPDNQGDVGKIRSDVATLAAEALGLYND
jgi:CubicO group peptidase (beta-lactamase class C family)